MKRYDCFGLSELRDRVVLTPEEKRVVTFIIAAFLLGVSTKCYRDARPATSIRIEKKHSTYRHARETDASLKRD